jgi:predicted peptidase
MLNFWISIVVCAALSFTALALGADVAAPSPATGQHAQKFQSDKATLDYLLYLPADYNKPADRKWPLIFFLHGSGERGADVMKVKKNGPPMIVENEPDSPLAKQFIVVSPQCPAGKSWKADDLSALLDDVMAKYRVDADRVYLTGLSMGGFGTWALAAKSPERFAAIAPMCGGGSPASADRLKSLPTWVFHGEDDPTVPIQKSQEMVDALKAVGADVKFTKYPGVGHDCWTKSYANLDLYSWFLSHKRGEKPKDAPATK